MIDEKYADHLAFEEIKLIDERDKCCIIEAVNERDKELIGERFKRCEERISLLRTARRVEFIEEHEKGYMILKGFLRESRHCAVKYEVIVFREFECDITLEKEILGVKKRMGIEIAEGIKEEEKYRRMRERIYNECYEI